MSKTNWFIVLVLLSNLLLLSGCTAAIERRQARIEAVPPTAAVPLFASPAAAAATPTPRPTRPPPTARPTAAASPTSSSAAYMTYYQQGMALLEGEGDGLPLDIPSALKALDQALQLQPDFVDAYLGRADAYLTLEDPQSALQEGQMALQLDPQNSRAHDILGFVSLLQEDYDQALTHFDQAILLDPVQARPYFHRGQVYFFMGDYAAAAADYSMAIELDPGAAEMWFAASLASLQLGRVEQALVEIDRAVALNDRDARFHFQRGLILRRQGALQDAISAYDVAIELDPKLAPAHHNRANILREEGRLQEALDGFERALQLDRDNPQTFLNQSAVFFDLGDYPAALNAADQAVQLDTSLTNAFLRRGQARLYSGDAQGAFEDFSQALTLDGPHPQSLSGLGRSLAFLGRYDDSLQALHEAHELQPDNLHLLTLIGTTFLAMDDTASALAQFDVLLRQLEESRVVEESDSRTVMISDDAQEAALVRLGRGRTWMILEDMEAGMADFRQAMRYDTPALLPELDLLINNGQAHYAAYLLRGLILAGQGEWDAARADYQAAADHGANAELHSRFLLERSETAAVQNDLANAILDMQAAVDLVPNQAGLYVSLGRLFYLDEQWQQAAENLSTALEGQADNIDALAYRGASRAELGDLEEAAADLCAASRLMEETGLAGDFMSEEQLEDLLQTWQIAC